MADVSHELGALRFVVDSPLSSKVAMFNNQAQQHKHSQSLNPFSQPGSRASSPKPTFSKDEYGKPLAGSLTEMRGQKANMHVMKEMLELCQIISSEGYDVKDEPSMRVIPFGELFNIYNYISDKVVGILLRARKHKLVDFEGEMLFQRRDDDVPIFLLRPILEIRRELEGKIDDIKRGASPAPQATSILLDRSAHKSDLSLPSSKRNSKSRSSSPKPPPTKIEVEPVASLTELLQNPTKDVATTTQLEFAAVETQTQNKNNLSSPAEKNSATAMKTIASITDIAKPVDANEVRAKLAEAIQTAPAITLNDKDDEDSNNSTETNNNATTDNTSLVKTAVLNETTVVPQTPSSLTDQNTDDIPTIVIEASAVYIRNAADAKESCESLSSIATSSNTIVSS